LETLTVVAADADCAEYETKVPAIAIDPAIASRRVLNLT
jgi:hypothetical protein